MPHKLEATAAPARPATGPATGRGWPRPETSRIENDPDRGRLDSDRRRALQADGGYATFDEQDVAPPSCRLASARATENTATLLFVQHKTRQAAMLRNAASTVQTGVRGPTSS